MSVELPKVRVGTEGKEKRKQENPIYFSLKPYALRLATL